MATPISHASRSTWPPREGLDPSRFGVGYDRVSDGLLEPSFGGALPAASFPISADVDHIFLLGNVATGRAVGIRAGLLASAAEQLPTLIDLVVIADPCGITPAKVAEGRQRRRCRQRSVPRSRTRAVAG